MDADSGGGCTSQKRKLSALEQGGKEEVPACLSCRKRKAKCSRTQPCNHCTRLGVDCTYDDQRLRAGPRAGAIDMLDRRLTSLEQMFMGQSILLRPLLVKADDARIAGDASESLSSLSASTRQVLCDAANGDNTGNDVISPSFQQAARQEDPMRSSYNDSDLAPELPSNWRELVDIYMDQVHRWIPVLHVRSFRERLEDATQFARLETVVHAVISMCLRLQPHSVSEDAMTIEKRCRRHRNFVVLRSMETFSLENLQASIIIAFDMIGSGRGPSAWSIIGSMARTVEHLQLHVEGDESLNERSQTPFIKRASFLCPPQRWIDEEERRRVFWTVFLLDRFCSIAAGWNNSLTDADVRRSLPCEGALWEDGERVRTPFFGIVTRSTAHAAELSIPIVQRQPSDDNETQNLGGFAFAIEAMENLNLINTFFLRQQVDPSNAKEVKIWLLRFKELDIRLVGWRLFLPSKWAEASSPDLKGGMDPNLVLAHVIHNTAVIQLHQSVAYPSNELKSACPSLPSTSSTETCTRAAYEIRTLVKEFVQRTSGVISPFLAFCLFLAGRALVAHSIYVVDSLPPDFGEIVNLLSELAQRWPPVVPATPRQAGSLAMKSALRLQQCRKNVQLGPYEHVYADEDIDSQASVTPSVAIPHENGWDLFDSGTSPHPLWPASLMPTPMMRPATPLAANGNGVPRVNVSINGNNGSLQSPMLADQFSGLFDESFDQMLRVSSYTGIDHPI